MANANEVSADRFKSSGTHPVNGTSINASRFSPADLEMLRGDLLQSGLDSWQAAEMIGTFVTGRGYGCSSDAAHHAVESMEETGFRVETLQSELEKLAMVM